MNRRLLPTLIRFFTLATSADENRRSMIYCVREGECPLRLLYNLPTDMSAVIGPTVSILVHLLKSIQSQKNQNERLQILHRIRGISTSPLLHSREGRAPRRFRGIWLVFPSNSCFSPALSVCSFRLPHAVRLGSDENGASCLVALSQSNP